MKIGFTGTRHGLEALQYMRLARLLTDLSGTQLHHGDCVGADETAAALAGRRGYRVIAHPPTDYRLRSALMWSHEYRLPKPFLERNRDIVDETELLIGCPAEPTEQQRGGTWYTIRYARRLGRRVMVINPDGTVIDSADARP